MNRLHHIKETLRTNIQNNSDYPDVEFVLVDYNSGDGLEAWVMDNFKSELASSTLRFFRTEAPTIYRSSHAKNMAHRASTGDIVCNLDADNFTGPGFAYYLNEHFTSNPAGFLSVDYFDKFGTKSDTIGRIACFRKDFETVGGYDEKIRGYGYGDIDLCERLKRLGKKQHFINNEELLRTIDHSTEERLVNSRTSEITRVYIHYSSPFESIVIFLFKNGRFSSGTLLDLNKGMGNPSIKEGKWIEGSFAWIADGKIQFESITSSFICNVTNGNLVDHQGRLYYSIINVPFLKRLELDYNIIGNHQIMVRNMESGIIKVNTL
jgi:hypothetical protein